MAGLVPVFLACESPSQARQCVPAAKEMNSKSIGLCPQGFESPRCRLHYLPFKITVNQRTAPAVAMPELFCSRHAYKLELHLWRKSPYRLVVRTSRRGRDNPGSTPGEDILSNMTS